jgi:four helix bundle protein
MRRSRVSEMNTQEPKPKSRRKPKDQGSVADKRVVASIGDPPRDWQCDGANSLKEDRPVYRAGGGEEAAPEHHAFDLEERTTRFAESVLRFIKQVPRGPDTNRLIDQLVGASSSIAANYCEADESVSKKDFRFSISRCRKEAKETKLFLRLIATAAPQCSDDCRRLWREARELHLIFCAIYRK